MITLPTQRVAASAKSPDVLILFGQTKVGKTTMLSQLDDCLIIDTEQGTKYLDAMKVEVNSLAELVEVGRALKASPHKYKYIAIDTIDNVADWIEQLILQQKGVSHIGDLPYGGGYSMQRGQTIDLITRFSQLGSKLILIAHRKKTIIGTETVEFSTTTIDLPGKLKNFLCADADAIGYVFRNEEGLQVSFRTEEDQVEVGSRVKHLIGKVIPFEWDQIYID